jgi:hypothetical protein
MKNTIAVVMSLVLLGALQLNPLWAAENTSEGTAPTTPVTVPATDLPLEHRTPIDAQKLQIAKELTDWLNRTLQEKKAFVAIVGRQGSSQSKKQDKTGMGHAGLAVYDPRAQSWIIYNLLNDLSDKTPKGGLWRTAPLDFFYGQKDYEKDALILIPDEITQQRMYEAILNGKYKKLFFTDRYNLLSAADSTSSLNCNKWLLLNVVAARIDDYDPVRVLSAIHKGFEPGTIRMNFLERQVVKGKANVQADEIPAFGPIQTVTVESLYRSDMFPQQLFFSGRQLTGN